MTKETQKSRKRKDKQAWIQDIASERIDILFRLAKGAHKTHPERSNRYVELARKIAMRYNVKIPKSYKRNICKYCYRYIFPGTNCIVRQESKNKTITIKCLECEKVTRIPYSKEKKND